MLGSVTIASNIAQAQYARGLIALCAGRHATAFGHLWRVFDPRDTAYHPIWGSWTISELAEAAVTAEHRDLARTALAELEVMGHQTPSPYLHVGLRHARAVLADDADAEGLFKTALDADPDLLAHSAGPSAARARASGYAVNAGSWKLATRCARPATPATSLGCWPGERRPARSCAPRARAATSACPAPPSG
ncbi:hypothetical protein GCM10020220_071380 [Nonomuraea rubra]|uniref:hypothetical protein n=1 Tax=Nonomuraea rubra TaxID=46180 RepID=UPI0031E75716